MEAAGLRVLQVTPRYFPHVGGAETHVHEVAWRLARAGADVEILTTDAEGRLPAEEQMDGVPVRRVPAYPRGRDYFYAPGVYRYIARGGWDIVHCQNYHTLVAPLAMLAALRHHIPYVVTFHSGGSSSAWRKSIRTAQALLLVPLLARACRLIAVSNFEAQLFSRRSRLPLARFTVIPNGCSMPVAPPGIAPRSDEPLILSVGRLERYKGHQRVIAALPKVLEQFPNARLRIAGSGPYEPELQSLARQLGVADRVMIKAVSPTDRQGMAALMASAAVVTLMSEYEAHPIAALETTALGRPLLVADMAGLHEFAERGLARSVPLKCPPETLAAAIVDQLRDPLIPERIDLPTWDDCAARLLAVYRDCARSPACAS